MWRWSTHHEILFKVQESLLFSTIYFRLTISIARSDLYVNSHLCTFIYCECVCICFCEGGCTFACMCTFVFLWLGAHLCMCTFVCVCTLLCAHLFMWPCVHIWVCDCVHICVWVCMFNFCLSVCTFIWIHTCSHVCVCKWFAGQRTTLDFAL